MHDVYRLISVFEPMSGVMEGKQLRMEEKKVAGRLKRLQRKEKVLSTKLLAWKESLVMSK